MISRFVLYFQSFQIFINICFALNADFVYPEQLFENSTCLLNTMNEKGICKEFTQCLSILREIETGVRRFDFQDHCSIFGSKELACCPLQDASTSVDFGLRPADVAAKQQIQLEPQFLKSIFGENEREDAIEGQYPFMASLGYRDKDKKLINYKCSGSLISPLYVLTAAHCIFNTNNEVPVEVLLGSVNHQIINKDVQRIPVLKLLPHPNYKSHLHYFDIALIKLDKPAEVTATVQPIVLHKSPLTPTDTANGQLLTAGFNLKKFGIESPLKVLKSFSLKLVNRTDCAKTFMGLGKLPLGLDESMKCGKDINEIRGFDVCQGDSGGPMFLRNGNTFSLAGVISFGIGCTGIAPTVYISIYHFSDWIENQILTW